jgi:acetyltransferase-like isoleucine patch superfamily enzyme
MKIIFSCYRFWILFLSQIRLAPFRLLGLRVGKSVLVNGKPDLPLLNLKSIFIGDGVVIGKKIWFFIKVGSPAKISIGNGTHLGHDITLSANEGIQIGKNCVLSYNVSIIDHNHVFGRDIIPTEGKITTGKKIIIEDGCFIGCNSVVLQGVKLGKHCVVGANTVVTKSFPDFSIIVGAAGRSIGTL